MQEVIGGGSLALIGLLFIIFPEKIYELTERWKYNSNAQMSYAYKIVLRIVGAVLVIAGICVAI